MSHVAHISLNITLLHYISLKQTRSRSRASESKGVENDLNRSRESESKIGRLELGSDLVISNIKKGKASMSQELETKKYHSASLKKKLLYVLSTCNFSVRL